MTIVNMSLWVTYKAHKFDVVKTSISVCVCKSNDALSQLIRQFHFVSYLDKLVHLKQWDTSRILILTHTRILTQSQTDTQLWNIALTTTCTKIKEQTSSKERPSSNLYSQTCLYSNYRYAVRQVRCVCTLQCNNSCDPYQSTSDVSFSQWVRK